MKLHFLASLAFLTISCSGCGEGGDSVSSQSSTTTAVALASPSRTAATSPGDPLPTLTADELLRFQAGQANFVKDESTETGFGPLFNGQSCLQCHNAPAAGGGGTTLVTRFGKTTGGVFDALVDEGGSVLQSHAIAGVSPEVVPADANTVAFRRPTSLLGLGLVEAIPDGDIAAVALTQAAENPDMAGQVCLVTSESDGQQHVGRFGWKSQHALLLDFAGDAYMNEMGINNALFPFENVANGPPTAVPIGASEDPADANGVRDIDRFADFMRFLAPLTTSRPPAAGQRVFEKAACAVCHHPAYTAISDVAAINGQPVQAYSDFLLHDVGTGDGIVQGNAPANKLRTAPLMGVSRALSLLHDGSVTTITAAIFAHGGQAAGSRQAFQQLSGEDRQALLEFLNTI